MTEVAPRQDAFRILILDDNPSTRNLAMLTLERNLPCAVERCANAADLIEKALARQPDLFLVDVDLGDGSGIDVCLDLKANPETEAIPVVFLSSRKDPAKRVEALNAGGVDYLNKPFYPEELVARVRIHIEIHRLRQENLSQIAEQQALLRVLCHDLVNPVFAAHSLLELKRDLGRPIDDATVDRVIGCCQSALDVITHVRTEHSLVKTNKQFHTENVSIADAFAESKRTLSERFAKKQVELETHASENLFIRINRVVLVHNILNNLLTNALKFSHPKSKVQLTAATAEHRSQPYCVIEVRDQGIGMPPYVLENVFSETAKVSRSGTANEEGTGFGMPLVKRYVEKSGGDIAVESVEQTEDAPDRPHGTTIRLRFPLSS